MTLAPGTCLGRYEIRSQIGAGGVGEVYLAERHETAPPIVLAKRNQDDLTISTTTSTTISKRRRREMQ